VLVDIAAAGVCHSDLHVMRGEWSLPLPLVMGHEGSGVVASVGEGVEHLSPGDHVVLSWYAPCGHCARCRLGRETQCLTNSRVVAGGGVLFDGTSRLSLSGTVVHHYLGVSSFAEQAVVPASGAIKVRNDAPLDLAALVGCAVATGVGAVTHAAKVEAGSTVVVIGTGGVGLSVVQGARLAGASRIVAVDLVASKLAVARRLGATDLVDASSTDPVEALLGLLPDGADYAFDAIGRPLTTEQAIRMLALGGAAVVVGLPAQGERACFEPLTLAEADQRIIGTNYGSIRPSADVPRLVDWAMDGRLDLEALVSARRPLAEAAEALVDLAEGRALRQLLVP
jgi:S-(hydroxymethyl)glutathione dehydrogenase/alcohol dehydrogenase